MSHPSLTPAQAERLEMLIGECSEVIQEASKILRHGYRSYHPGEPKVPNEKRLMREIGDLNAVLEKMIVKRDLVSVVYLSDQESARIWQNKLIHTHHQS